MKNSYLQEVANSGLAFFILAQLAEIASIAADLGLPLIGPITVQTRHSQAAAECLLFSKADIPWLGPNGGKAKRVVLALGSACWAMAEYQANSGIRFLVQKRSAYTQRCPDKKLQSSTAYRR
jgi:hypothetical protein